MCFGCYYSHWTTGVFGVLACLSEDVHFGSSVVLIRGGEEYWECYFVQRRIGVFRVWGFFQRRIGVFGVLFCSEEDRSVWSVVLFRGG